MTKSAIEKRSNCKPILAFHEVLGKHSFFSISEAALQTGLSKATVQRLLDNGKHSITGWRFIFDQQKKQNPELVLRLTKDEVDALYRSLKDDLKWVALKVKYQDNFSWPLYDKLAELVGTVNNSHDEYEYWRDWLEKNRDDLYEDRYADREDDDE